MPQYNLGHPEILKRIDLRWKNIQDLHWQEMVIVELVFLIAFILANWLWTKSYATEHTEFSNLEFSVGLWQIKGTYEHQ